MDAVGAGEFVPDLDPVDGAEQNPAESISNDVKEFSGLEKKTMFTAVNATQQIGDGTIEGEITDFGESVPGGELPATEYRHSDGSAGGDKESNQDGEGNLSDMTVHLKDEHLLGKVSLCPFLVAKKDLDHFPNQDWVEDYHGVTFQIEKGTILAIVRSRHLPWKKKKRISARFRLYLRFIRKRHRKSAPITLTSSVDPYYNAKRSHRVTPPVQSENIHLIHNI